VREDAPILVPRSSRISSVPPDVRFVNMTAPAKASTPAPPRTDLGQRGVRQRSVKQRQLLRSLRTTERAKCRKGRVSETVVERPWCKRTAVRVW
jgi:hypothetical protein